MDIHDNLIIVNNKIIFEDRNMILNFISLNDFVEQFMNDELYFNAIINKTYSKESDGALIQLTYEKKWTTAFQKWLKDREITLDSSITLGDVKDFIYDLTVVSSYNVQTNFWTILNFDIRLYLATVLRLLNIELFAFIKLEKVEKEAIVNKAILHLISTNFIEEAMNLIIVQIAKEFIGSNRDLFEIGLN